jgi:ABC-type multidrug transport system permease subunit
MMTRDRIEFFFVFFILVIILFVAIAIVVVPQFAQFMAFVIALLAFIGIGGWLSNRSRKLVHPTTVNKDSKPTKS